MSYGIPVVATNVGGVSELVSHGYNGYLVPIGDINSLIKFCNLLINNFEVRNNIGLNAKNFIREKFSEKHMVSDFSGVFKSIVKL